jgi:ABC-type sugar transport system substrate-binding protein
MVLSLIFLSAHQGALAKYGIREPLMFCFFARNVSAPASHFQKTHARTSCPGWCTAGALATLAVSVAIMASGCDSSSTFLPPPPDGLRGSAAEESASNANIAVPPRLENTVAGARSVELLLDRRDPNDSEVIVAAARMQAGLDKVKIRPVFLGQKDSPARQVEQAREAVARNALALVIEPADPTDRKLAEVVQNARESGIPVVLVGRPLGAASSAEGTSKGALKIAKGSGDTATTAKSGASATLASTGTKPLVVIAPPPFAESARQLVASAIRNAKNAKLDPKGGAVIMSHPGIDSFVNERIAAIRSALKDNGITAIDEIESSKPPEATGKALIEKLKSNPKVILVFAVDGLSTAAAKGAMAELIPDRLFVVSAYPGEATYSDLVRVGDFAAVAGFVPLRMIRKAVNTAVSLSQGHELPGRIEFAVEVLDSAPDSKTPQSPIYYKGKTSKAAAKAKESP